MIQQGHYQVSNWQGDKVGSAAQLPPGAPGRQLAHEPYYVGPPTPE